MFLIDTVQMVILTQNDNDTKIKKKTGKIYNESIDINRNKKQQFDD